MESKQHELYKDGDVNIPEQLLDQAFGQVALDCCKICGLTEIQLLEQPTCPGFPNMEAEKRYKVEASAKARQKCFAIDKEIELLRKKEEELKEERGKHISIVLKFSGFKIGSEVRLFSKHVPGKVVFHGEIVFEWNDYFKVQAYYADGRKRHHRYGVTQELTRLTEGMDRTKRITLENIDQWVLVPEKK